MKENEERLLQQVFVEYDIFVQFETISSSGVIYDFVIFWNLADCQSKRQPSGEEWHYYTRLSLSLTVLYAKKIVYRRTPVMARGEKIDTSQLRSIIDNTLYLLLVV